MQLSQEAITKIQERDRTTNESTSRIIEAEKKSTVLFNELEDNLKKANQSSEEIRQQQEDLKEISLTLQKKLSEAQQLLEDTNRYGLAGAFKTRKEELKWPAIRWIGLFFLCIFGLGWLAWDSLEKLGTDWHFLLFRIPFSAPLVWLGWFSVKQYGYTRRIQEDYSFKVAAAMSFQGYKNEVGDDVEMIKLLRRSSIENFSANPIRIYSNGKNHGSPVHELLESFSMEDLKKIVELLKVFTSKK